MKIKPDARFQKIEDISPEYLKAHNISGILLDIDNTIVVDGKTEISAAVLQWLKNIDLPVCLLSNGKEPRVKMLARNLGLHYIFRAKKPIKKGYIQGAALLGISDFRQIAVIGDQILSDIWGGVRIGCYTIKVEPIDPSADPFPVKMKRLLEKLVT
ncbi:MAG: YqeG family HAD IIIA-type phosphatase [Clostridiales bacterium]|nr:YqeG family HAD IIIA-type phosphatase [Clostridiales bacterium]